jgi:hypothetical protein
VLVLVLVIVLVLEFLQRLAVAAVVRGNRVQARTGVLGGAWFAGRGGAF